MGGCAGAWACRSRLRFADRGARVGIYDVSQTSVDMVEFRASCRSPNPARLSMLHRVLAAARLEAWARSRDGGDGPEHVVVVIGTPVDERLNPNQTAITKALSECTATCAMASC